MTPCPCCGFLPDQPTPDMIGQMLALARYERRVFDCLVKNFGKFTDTSKIIDEVYFDDIDGGPIHARQCVYVTTYKLKAKIAGTALMIDSRRGINCGIRLRWRNQGAAA